MLKRSLLAVCLGLAALVSPASAQLAGASADRLAIATLLAQGGGKLTVTSQTFAAGQAIPHANSAYGDNRSPQLSCTPGPAGTVSYVVIIEDPDLGAGRPPYLHWVLGDLTAKTTSIPAGLTETPMGAFQTGASVASDKLHYFGPRPPSGTHNYTFQVFALDRRLGLYDGSNLADVKTAMQGHVLASGALQGTFTAPPK